MSNSDSVDNTVLREAVKRRLAEGETLSGICRRLEWGRVDRPTKMDTTRLRRRLGMAPVINVRRGRRTEFTSKAIRYDVAVRICQAIDGDPVELGL